MDEQKRSYTSFAELKEACINFVKASKGRGAYTGLKKLLTELYPDKAHFVYELLQNAEDQEATDVEFILYNDRLLFRHNGKKRDFILSDIDSITNIGNSTKSDDPTTIGQFGVGFKAVYAYTNTPEIHSGEYDFKIVDMLIPEDAGVEKRAQKGVTEFIFPFDNPNKAPDLAVLEISNTLKELNETAILFLQHMKKKEALHEVKFILCKDGNLHCASEGLFFETDYKPMYIRNPIYVDLGKGNKERTESLRDFFILLGVQDMTIQLDTMSEIENTTDSDDVVLKLLEIIDYYKEKGEVEEFLESAFILARRADDQQLGKVKASECCWDDTVHFFYKGEVDYIVAMD